MSERIELSNGRIGGWLFLSLFLSILALFAVWPSVRPAVPEALAIAEADLATKTAALNTAVIALEVAKAEAAKDGSKQSEVEKASANVNSAQSGLKIASATRDEFAKITVQSSRFLDIRDGETRLVLIAIFAAMAGGALHALKSFAYFKASGGFNAAYGWWYIARLPMAGAIGLFTYFALRGGVFPMADASATDAARNANPFGLAAISALVGMYSGRAIRKLGDLFDVLFGSDDLPGAKDMKIAGKEIKIAKNASGDELKIILEGTGFPKNVEASIDGKAVDVLRAESSDSKIAIRLTPDQLKSAKDGLLKLSLRNPHDRTVVTAEIVVFDASTAPQASNPRPAHPPSTTPDAKPAPGIASVSKVKKDATGDGLKVTVKLTALDPAKLKVFVDNTESTSAVGPDKKSLVFDLAEEKAKSAGKIPFTLKDDAGKEYKSEVEIVA